MNSLYSSGLWESPSSYIDTINICAIYKFPFYVNKLGKRLLKCSKTTNIDTTLKQNPLF